MAYDEAEAAVRSLMDRAADEETGPVQVALLEQAVRMADTHGHVPLGFESRLALVRAAVFAEEPEKPLAPFAWCLAQCDRDPVTYPESRLLWEFKWVVDNAKNVARVPMTGLLAMVDDMERRYRRNGGGVRAANKSRVELAMFRGLRDEAREHYRRWDASPRDRFADCRACEQNKRVEFLAFDLQDEAALAAAAPILAGRMRCAEVPLATYRHVLLPLLRLGRVAEAMTYHNKAHRLIARKPMYVEDAADHLRFLALTGNFPRALKLLETHLPWPRSELALLRAHRFDFALSARFLLGLVAAARNGKPVSLRLPKEFPLHAESGRYDPATLSSFFADEAARLASIFDARNGTTHFADRIASDGQFAALMTPCPLRPAPPGVDPE